MQNEIEARSSYHRIKILALDGGPSTMVTLRILRKLEERYPGLLERVDMFCGTSNGGFISLYLSLAANQGKTGLEAIEGAIRFSNDIMHSFKAGPREWLRLASGTLSMFDGRKLHETLECHFGKDTRLIDLKKPVVVSVFDATRAELATYDAFTPDGDGTATLLEVALATSSLPVMLPGFRPNEGPRKGHLLLDGGLSSNSSILLGMSNALRCLFSEDIGAMLQRVSVLSLGCTSQDLKGFAMLDEVLERRVPRGGRNRSEFGWLRLLVTGLHGVLQLVQGTSARENDHARQMLGARNYYRFQPGLPMFRLVFGCLLNPEHVLARAELLADELWHKEQLLHRQNTPHRLEGQDAFLLDWIEQFWLTERP